MKTPSLIFTFPIPVLAAAVTAFIALPAVAQEDKDATAAPAEERSTDLTNESDDEVATGRVFSIEPNVLLVTPANVSIPLTFSYNAKTPLIDEAEKPVPWDQLRTGIPITVHYDTKDEKLIATKVTVTRKMLTGGDSTPPEESTKKREMLAEVQKQKALENAERAKSQPAAGGGTIMGFEQVIVVRPSDSSNVTQYVVNNSTLYVDSAGQPVPLHVVRTGAPVSIQYVEDAGRRIATQFVFERVPQDAQPGSGTGTGTGSGTGAGATGTGSLNGNRTSGDVRALNSSGGGTTTGGAVLDQHGNLQLADGFLSPPVTVLPAATEAARAAAASANQGTAQDANANGDGQQNQSGAVTSARNRDGQNRNANNQNGRANNQNGNANNRNGNNNANGRANNQPGNQQTGQNGSQQNNNNNNAQNPRQPNTQQPGNRQPNTPSAGNNGTGAGPGNSGTGSGSGSGTGSGSGGSGSSSSGGSGSGSGTGTGSGGRR